MRRRSTTLTEQELEIMKVVWERDHSTVRDVYETLLERRKIAYTTVMTMMKILEQKKYLKKTLADRAYVYRPAQPKGQVIGDSDMRYRRLLFLTLFLGASGLALAANLDGRIVEDHTGNPLASVEVRVYKTGQRTLAPHLETDSSGRFRAPGLGDGEYRIEATKANFVGATVRLASLAGGLLIRLVRCGVITGQVVDAQGQPILGVAVYAMPKPLHGPLMPFSAPAAGSLTRVDERGQYRLFGLPPGEYAVAAAYGASTSMSGSSGGAEVRSGIGSGVQVYPSNLRPQVFAVTGVELYRNIDFSIVPAGLHNLSGKVELPDPKSKYWLALTTADQPARW